MYPMARSFSRVFCAEFVLPVRWVNELVPALIKGLLHSIEACVPGLPDIDPERVWHLPLDILRGPAAGKSISLDPGPGAAARTSLWPRFAWKSPPRGLTSRRFCALVPNYSILAIH